MNKEIIDKVNEIINEIENSLVYQKYLTLKKQMANNQELMELINKVRVGQKDVVHKKIKKEELDKLMNELNSNPLYIEYNNALFEINNTFSIIESRLNKYFERITN